MKKLIILLLFPLSLFSQKMGLITNNIYDVDVYVISTDSKLEAKLFINGILGNVSEDSDFDNKAMTFYDDGSQIVVWFPKLSKTFEDLSTINHEVSHVITAILERIGVPLSEDTSEVHAYMTGFYNKNFYKIVYGDNNKYKVLSTFE